MDAHRPAAAEIKSPWPVNVVGGLLVVWALVHSIRTRTIEDYVRYSLYIAVPIAVILLASTLWEWRKSRFRRPSPEEMWNVVFMPIPLLLFAAWCYSIGAAIKDAYLWLQSPTLSRDEAVIGAIAITFTLGLGLFYFRLRLRSLYGLTEAAVGLAVAAQRVATVATEVDLTTQDSAFYLVILTAAVYLVVRGLDNVHQGLTKTPLVPVATRIFEGIKAMSVQSAESNEK